MNAISRTKEPPTATGSLFITRHDAATRYALSLRTVDSLLSDGVLPAVRLSARCIRIPREQADEALMKFKTGGFRHG